MAEYNFGFSGGDDPSAHHGGGDGACFNCGQEGHNRADCPQPHKPRNCFNCGEPGHTKADCTNEAVAREFTGKCRLCEEDGHRASDCPKAPPRTCSNCKEQGHAVKDCKNPRAIDRSGIPDLTPAEAWGELKDAASDRDMDDIKAAVDKYIKVMPDITYSELEIAFRAHRLSVHLIALEREIADTLTNMDLQGNLDCKYTVSWRLSSIARRPKERDAWPATPEENLERLKNAGEPVDRGLPKCRQCDKLGHTAKFCPQEKIETEKVVVKCYNCDGVGHRVRDCPNPRPQRGGGACRNCGGQGHKAADCTEEKVLICRNCDEKGHSSKECPKPRDYSRVKCINCEQYGHTKVKCPEPPKAKDEEETGTAASDNGGGEKDEQQKAPDTSNFSNFDPVADAPANW